MRRRMGPASMLTTTTCDTNGKEHRGPTEIVASSSALARSQSSVARGRVKTRPRLSVSSSVFAVLP